MAVVSLFVCFCLPAPTQAVNLRDPDNFNNALNVIAKALCKTALHHGSRLAMTDLEFETLLACVGDAMSPRRSLHADKDEDFAAFSAPLPMPANDNDAAWPLLPFPTGWTASC